MLHGYVHTYCMLYIYTYFIDEKKYPTSQTNTIALLLGNIYIDVTST